MLRKFNRKVFSHISVEENEDVIDAAPEVSANGEGTYDMSTPELENEKQELVELGDGIDAGVEEIETCCDDCETVIEIDNIVKDSVDSNNGLDQTSINIINTTVENMLKRHGLSRMRFRIPSVERYGRPLDKVKQAKVALEGIGDIFSWIWKKIKEIWEAICKFFRKLFGNSLNIFKKEIKQAYNAVMELKKDKKLLANSLNASDDNWKMENLKITNNVEACCILQELNSKSYKNNWLVGTADTIRLLGNKKKGIIALMNHPEFLKTEIDNAISSGSMIALDKAMSGKDVSENKEVVTSICEHFDLPEILIKHYRKDEDFRANLGYCVDPEGISEGVVDDLVRLVEELKKESDKADEEALDKYMQQIEGSLTESIKKGRINDDMKDDEKKKILENIKNTSSTIATAVKNLYKYLIGYVTVVALAAVNIKDYINLLKKENK